MSEKGELVGQVWGKIICLCAGVRCLSWFMLCLPEVGMLLRRFMYRLNHRNLRVCIQMLRLLRNAEAKKNLQGGLATCALFVPEILTQEIARACSAASETNTESLFMLSVGCHLMDFSGISSIKTSREGVLKARNKNKIFIFSCI